MLLVLLGSSLFFEGAKATEADQVIDIEGNIIGLYVSFAEWCSTRFCNLRLFTVIGGELLMVDSVSYVERVALLSTLKIKTRMLSVLARG